MSALHAVEHGLQRLGAQVTAWSGRGLNPVTIDRSVLSRGLPESGSKLPRGVSRNGCCRLLRTRDRWIAINLPRPDDLELVPALLGGDFDGDPWSAIELHCRELESETVLSNAHLLGIAASALGEAKCIPAADDLPAREHDAEGGIKWTRRPLVIDLSALWAGPLCGALLAQAGCEVIKVESTSRPDRTADRTDAYFRELNRRKTLWRIDFNCSMDRRKLIERLDMADVIITSARRRGLDSLGISPEVRRGENSKAIWIAITSHGLSGPNANRVGFGDDCAVAGGLVAYDPTGTPEFIHDAVADPLTGLRAAAIAFRALARRRGRIAEVSLAETAAIVNSSRAWTDE